MLDILNNFADGNLNAEQTISKMNELRADIPTMKDENINQLAEKILKQAPTVRDNFSRGIQKYSDNIDQQKSVSDAFKKYVTSIAEKNAEVNQVLSCFEPGYFLGSQPEEMLLEELKHSDIPELLNAAKANPTLRSFAEDNALWIPIAKHLGYDDIDPDQSVKQQVKERYELLRKQIKESTLLETVTKAQLLRSPPTVQNIVSLQHSLIATRINQISNNPQNDVQNALSSPSFENNRFLEKWVNARDSLIVWTNIAETLHIPMPTLDETSGQKMIDQAAGFSEWMTAHQAELNTLQDLELSDQQLTSLPREIGNLTGLQTLALRHNQLTSLPQEIGNLTRLQTLYLNHNKLTSLPPEIGNLIALTSLNLSDNQLSLLPPQIGQLIALTSLDLSYNQLSSLPSQIGQLIALTSLDLSYNQLSTLPSEISHLSALTFLHLNGNNLTSLPEFVKLTNLSIGIDSESLSRVRHLLPPNVILLE